MVSDPVTVNVIKRIIVFSQVTWEGYSNWSPPELIFLKGKFAFFRHLLNFEQIRLKIFSRYLKKKQLLYLLITWVQIHLLHFISL